jgi:hypothetical protein
MKMMTVRRSMLVGFVAGVSLLTGCTDDGSDDKPDVSDVKGGPDGKAEAWGAADNPALFNANLEYRATELPRTGEATNIPWAGNYWPVYQDSINYKWAGASSEAPSTKYAEAFGITGVEDGVSRYHGVDAHATRTTCTTDSQCNSAMGEKCAKRDGLDSGRCIPTWWGICHAWAPLAILLPEPKKPVTYNGVEFKINDIKALLTLVFDRTQTKFVSLRCDAYDSENEIAFDKYGRPTGANGTNCRDTNPGTFHVLISNYIGMQGESFVYDRTFDAEVWNQPLRGYRITQFDEVSATEANRLVGVTSEGGSTVEHTGNVVRNAWTQLGSFPVAAGQSVVVAMTGSGDADLYVKFGSQPTASAYDCRPYDGTTNETCTLTAPQGATQVFVGVHGYAATSDYTVSITTGGSVPTEYVFNDKAVKFYKVHMDVDFIAESAAETDGNLGSTIDRYTHTDRYDYILEVDTNGKIIGGEWLGESKRNHPDFLWLPIRSTSTTVAGGKITFANVKMIYDLSMQDGSGGTGGTVRDITETGTVTRSQWKHYGPFNVAAGSTLVATMTGDNDADLYVRKGAAPTASSYDCRPYRDGSSEQCSIVGPATIYVGVNGYAASSNFSLNIKYTEGGGTTPPTPPPATFTHLNTTGSVTQGEMKVFPLEIPAGKRVVVRTTSTKDVDLYIQFGAAPTTSSYINRGYTTSGNETVTYTATSNGTLFIGVHGYQAGSFTLRTADM